MSKDQTTSCYLRGDFCKSHVEQLGRGLLEAAAGASASTVLLQPESGFIYSKYNFNISCQGGVPSFGFPAAAALGSCVVMR